MHFSFLLLSFRRLFDWPSCWNHFSRRIQLQEYAWLWKAIQTLPKRFPVPFLKWNCRQWASHLLLNFSLLVYSKFPLPLTLSTCRRHLLRLSRVEDPQYHLHWDPHSTAVSKICCTSEPWCLYRRSGSTVRTASGFWVFSHWKPFQSRWLCPRLWVPQT